MAVLAVCGMLLAACGLPESDADLGSYPSQATVLITDAESVMDGLPVNGRAPKTGNEREELGDGWVDTDANGCDTRNDILQRDLVEAEVRDESSWSAGYSTTRTRAT